MELAARPAWRPLVRACYAHPGQVGLPLDLVVHLFSHAMAIKSVLGVLLCFDTFLKVHRAPIVMTPVWAQVRSLTQFYSVNFSQSRISVNVKTHNQGLRQLFLRCPGPSTLLTCPSVSVVSAAAQKVRLRALEGRSVSSKSPSRTETETR